MMRSLYSGVSGLKNHQTRMDVVGNNISNVNTTGFKSGRVTFADTLSQTLTGASAATDNRGGTNPKQIGLGSQISAVDLLFTDGSVQSTGVNTDLCLSGNGLFVVGEGTNVYYTRNGNFSFDKDGNYCTDDGLKVKGWMADNNGKIDTTKGETYIKIPADSTMPATATTKINYSSNLQSSAAMITKISGGQQVLTPISSSTTAGTSYTGAYGKTLKLTYANGVTAASVSSGTYTVGSTTATTIDSGKITIATGSTATVVATLEDSSTTPPTTSTTTLTGIAGTYTIGDVYPAGASTKIKSFSVTDTLNQIDQNYESYKASTGNAATITLNDGTTQVMTSGSYVLGYSLPVTTTVTVYDSLGNKHDVPIYFTKTEENSTTGNNWLVQINLDGTGTTTSGSTSFALADTALNFTTTGKYNSGNGSLILTLNNGATGTQTVTVDLSALTQYAGSTTAFGSNDGNADGKLKSISVDSSGIITGTYTNGVNKQEAQVAVAQFNNAAGLTKVGGSLYSVSNNSGKANIKTAAALGCTITPSALEMSNVDLASELSDMIITQRGFQSNSKIITVSDEMIETLVNMKR